MQSKLPLYSDESLPSCDDRVVIIGYTLKGDYNTLDLMFGKN
ncbi:hypothetical protein [Candidatus Neoehrlichia procyonis]|uniref:Uncharacterized protein n=1 Tax=Candidatus Neoehrlichia procyonis str. RAC413 TaxID=1359163 RepID=A0A0F3NN67_9RICK|nr:hypothetical protein [Candidatus Neoehrlichia lotoris]KJV69505.1 hypothetical protein NLO413_0898 [Candidatus Neoehrlichia lotoris str. RAC413]